MRLKFAAMNLKKLAGWKAGKAFRSFSARFSFVFHSTLYGLSGDKLNRPFFDRLSRYTYYVYRLLVFMLHGGRATVLVEDTAVYQTAPIAERKCTEVIAS